MGPQQTKGSKERQDTITLPEPPRTPKHNIVNVTKSNSFLPKRTLTYSCLIKPPTTTNRTKHFKKVNMNTLLINDNKILSLSSIFINKILVKKINEGNNLHFLFVENYYISNNTLNHPDSLCHKITERKLINGSVYQNSILESCDSKVGGKVYKESTYSFTDDLPAPLNVLLNELSKVIEKEDPHEVGSTKNSSYKKKEPHGMRVVKIMKKDSSDRSTNIQSSYQSTERNEDSLVVPSSERAVVSRNSQKEVTKRVPVATVNCPVKKSQVVIQVDSRPREDTCPNTPSSHSHINSDKKKINKFIPNTTSSKTNPLHSIASSRVSSRNTTQSTPESYPILNYHANQQQIPKKQGSYANIMKSKKQMNHNQRVELQNSPPYRNVIEEYPRITLNKSNDHLLQPCKVPMKNAKERKFKFNLSSDDILDPQKKSKVKKEAMVFKLDLSNDNFDIGISQGKKEVRIDNLRQVKLSKLKKLKLSIQKDKESPFDEYLKPCKKTDVNIIREYCYTEGNEDNDAISISTEKLSYAKKNTPSFAPNVNPQRENPNRFSFTKMENNEPSNIKLNFDIREKIDENEFQDLEYIDKLH